MGLLSFVPRPTVLNLVRLPSGSFTVDPSGKILISTLPRAFPESWVEEIGKHVLNIFRGAQAAQVPLRELVADYSALRLTARDMRGGAIIFLTPQSLGRK
jgi:hypothetical protein